MLDLIRGHIELAVRLVGIHLFGSIGILNTDTFVPTAEILNPLNFGVNESIFILDAQFAEHIYFYGNKHIFPFGVHNAIICILLIP